MAPNLQEFFSCEAPVACSHVCGLSVRSHMTAGLDGFRGSRPYQLVGIGIPLRRSGFSRTVGSTTVPAMMRIIRCLLALVALVVIQVQFVRAAERVDLLLVLAVDV